jgi:hypothetical protein
MDQHTVKRERDDALQRITNVAGLLSLDAQIELNRKLNELVTLILKKRDEERP